MIKISLTRLKIYRNRETLNCLIEVTHPIQRNTFVVVSKSILGLNYYRCCIVIYRLFKLAQFIICKSSVKKSFEMIRVNIKCLCVELNCLVIVPLLTCLVAFSMVLLCLLLQNRILELFLHDKRVCLYRWLLIWCKCPLLLRWLLRSGKYRFIVSLACTLFMRFLVNCLYMVFWISVIIICARYSTKTYSCLLLTSAWT